MAQQYDEIPGGYKLWLTRVGKVLENPAGKQVYFQPGDSEASLLETIEAIDEIPADRQGIIADIALADYFA